MLNLGTIVDDLGPRPNAREAVYWFKRGIRAGDYTAAYNLAMHYKNRRQDRWYIHRMAVAAKMGDPDALKIVRKEAGATGKQKSKSDTGT